jgi:hypothetical protein
MFDFVHPWIFYFSYKWIITNTMHYLSSVNWVITRLHVLGVSAAHHQKVECIYVANGTCYISELTVSGPLLFISYHTIISRVWQTRMVWSHQRMKCLFAVSLMSINFEYDAQLKVVLASCCCVIFHSPLMTRRRRFEKWRHSSNFQTSLLRSTAFISIHRK